MNKKLFTSLISVGLIAGLAACSSGNGESNTPAKQAINKRNDLEALETKLAAMDALDVADSSVRSMQVEGLDMAKHIFRCIVAESCKFNSETKSVDVKLDEARLAMLDNGNIEYKMSDESGNAQGTATLVIQGVPEQGILAYAEISANGNNPVQKLNFVDRGAWPENRTPPNCSPENGVCIPTSPIYNPDDCEQFCSYYYRR